MAQRPTHGLADHLWSHCKPQASFHVRHEKEQRRAIDLICLEHQKLEHCPTQASSKSRWTCGSCNEKNRADRESCNNCGLLRPPVADEAEGDHTWLLARAASAGSAPSPPPMPRLDSPEHPGDADPAA